MQTPTKTRLTITLTLFCVLASCKTQNNQESRRPIGTVSLSSDFQPLVDGFQWARAQSLEYVFEGDPVGPWFEASLPGREAFCMRDVSHQALGGLVLGLAEHTKNMMRRFAENIAESRDWCSYWEINRYNQPAPVDYRSDEDFWYNLPANFDVIRSIYEVHEWTGDEEYLHNPVFDNFYRHSLIDYVNRWDEDGDGLMESPGENGIRGIPTYWEGGGPRALTGGDLVAAQYSATRAYEKMLLIQGDSTASAQYRQTADRLKSGYNDDWWNADLSRFHTSILEDRSFDTTYTSLMQVMPLYFEIVDRENRAEPLLESLKEGANIEERSYLAETYYRYGRHERAFGALMAQMDPDLPRREYPENPFTAVGTVSRWMVGINPIASEGAVETMSRLPEQVGWVRLKHVPVLGNQISVQHTGTHKTRLFNESGPPVTWRAVFQGFHEQMMVDGAAREATIRTSAGGVVESFVTVTVGAGTEHVVLSQN